MKVSPESNAVYVLHPFTSAVTPAPFRVNPKAFGGTGSYYYLSTSFFSARFWWSVISEHAQNAPGGRVPPLLFFCGFKFGGGFAALGDSWVKPSRPFRGFSPVRHSLRRRLVAAAVL
jgi:hypothetical protein